MERTESLPSGALNLFLKHTFIKDLILILLDLSSLFLLSYITEIAFICVGYILYFNTVKVLMHVLKRK